MIQIEYKSKLGSWRELGARVTLKEEQGNKLESVSFRKIEKILADQEIGKYLEHLTVEKTGKAGLHLVYMLLEKDLEYKEK